MAEEKNWIEAAQPSKPVPDYGRMLATQLTLLNQAILAPETREKGSLKSDLKNTLLIAHAEDFAFLLDRIQEAAKSKGIKIDDTYKNSLDETSAYLLKLGKNIASGNDPRGLAIAITDASYAYRLVESEILPALSKNTGRGASPTL